LLLFHDQSSLKEKSSHQVINNWLAFRHSYSVYCYGVARWSMIFCFIITQRTSRDYKRWAWAWLNQATRVMQPYSQLYNERLISCHW
jgi:hypothetical protein